MNKIKNINALFESFSKMNVLIIGDVMVDSYLWGKVERISPEAPVPIVAVTKREDRLGGAANVALNIKALGANPILCSVIGNDTSGKLFLEMLRGQQMSNEGIVGTGERTTTVKTRVIGNQYQMLRIDEETDIDTHPADKKKLLEHIMSIISSKKIDVIIFEDYDKGVVDKELVEKVVGLAEKNNIPVTADPKKKNFNHYKNITLFKPNLKELREGLKADFESDDLKEIIAAVKEFNKQHNIRLSLVTLSEKGILLCNAKSSHHIPAHVRNITDVSGAGDTVISVASLCLAAGLEPESIAILANLAGGQVCEKVGVVSVDKDQLMEEGKELLKF